MRSIEITLEMYDHAVVEQQRRDPYIQHHFDVEHVTGEQRDILGFLGEFACCAMLGIDWRENIRNDYLTIDSGDIAINGYVFDVKTETMPDYYLRLLQRGRLDDNRFYGRRLINGDQVPLLDHYDAVIFGAFVREEVQENPYPLHWHALGYAPVEQLLDSQRYPITSDTPFGRRYPTPVLAFRTSELQSIDSLLSLIRSPR